MKSMCDWKKFFTFHGFTLEKVTQSIPRLKTILNIRLDYEYRPEFPADEKRKEIWIKRCAKRPKGDLRLCEFHFDDSQFENKRQDGRRKLKPNAIPTIFINEEKINKVLQDEAEFSVGVLPEENVIDQINIQHNQSVRVDAETQTEVYNNVAFNTIQFSDKDGTIRQANEIKYLKKKLAETIKENNKLTLKFKREKLLRLKHEKAHKNFKIKFTTLFKNLTSMDNVDYFT